MRYTTSRYVVVEGGSALLASAEMLGVLDAVVLLDVPKAEAWARSRQRREQAA